jgi:hypothetical protein
VALAAVAVALFQMVPASAAGIGTLRYPAKDKAVPNAEPGVTSSTVNCPSDHPLVTGGGAEITGDESTLDLEIGTTLPAKDLKGWKVTANNSSASAASMHVTAICARSHVTFRSSHKVVLKGRQGSLKVACPTGTTLIGGGVGISGTNHMQEVASSAPFDGKDADHKTDDGWAGRANNGLNKKVTMTVAAVCARSGSFRFVHSAGASVADNTQLSASVTCPSGTTVTGGGVSITGSSLGVEVGDSFPIDGADVDTTPDDGWQATANNDSTGRSQTMQVFAICKA